MTRWPPLAVLAETFQTRDELLARGASHPTLRVTELPRVPLSVGGAGLRIKKNARVSTLVAAEPAHTDCRNCLPVRPHDCVRSIRQ
jgi:hypothetical protein